MEQILYSEIELICMAVDGLLLYWAARREAKSASDQWLILVLICFFCKRPAETVSFVSDQESSSVAVYFLVKTLRSFKMGRIYLYG